MIRILVCIFSLGFLHAHADVRDSLASYSPPVPATNLPEMFQRLLSIPLPVGRHTVAILPFQESGVGPSDYRPGLMAAEFGTTRLSSDPRFLLVERQALDKLLSEQALVQSGAISDSAAAQSGRLVSARYLVLGRVDLQGGFQHISSRLVDVESGAVLSAASAVLGEGEARNLYLTALGERVQVSSAVYRSLVVPGWGQTYCGRPIAGGLWTALAVVSLGNLVHRTLVFQDKDAAVTDFKDKNPSTVLDGDDAVAWSARANAAVSERNQAAKDLGLAFGLAGGIWVTNLLDAWLVGRTESNRIKAHYFSARTAVVPLVGGSSLGAAMTGRF